MVRVFYYTAPPSEHPKIIPPMLRLLHISTEVERTVLSNLLTLSQSLLVGGLGYSVNALQLKPMAASACSVIRLLSDKKRRYPSSQERQDALVTDADWPRQSPSFTARVHGNRAHVNDLYNG